MTDHSFRRFEGKFSLDAPRAANGFGIYKDAWKFDFDKLSPEASL